MQIQDRFVESFNTVVISKGYVIVSTGIEGRENISGGDFSAPLRSLVVCCASTLRINKRNVLEYAIW